KNETDQVLIFDKIYSDGSKYPGTCSWVVQHHQISKWIRNEIESSYLWLQGTPGAGKTVISGQLISFLKRLDAIVISHFCTYSFASSTNYEEILKSLLFQLLRLDGDLVAHVFGEFVLENK